MKNETGSYGRFSFLDKYFISEKKTRLIRLKITLPIKAVFFFFLPGTLNTGPERGQEGTYLHLTGAPLAGDGHGSRPILRLDALDAEFGRPLWFRDVEGGQELLHGADSILAEQAAVRVRAVQQRVRRQPGELALQTMRQTRAQRLQSAG